MTATVETTGLGKRWGATEALRNVDLQLAPAETVALLGHNGAGKSTLMKLMLGLLAPTAGRVRVFGTDPARGGSALRRRIGHLPENVAFGPALTGRETLRFYARLKGRSETELGPMLERVDLADAADRRVATYSKGMRQRLGLAQALLGDPDLLVLDEPTTGLDPASRRTFWDLVEEARKRGATVLVSSHALTELADRAGRVVVMHRGDVLADGGLDHLRRLARLPTRVRVTPSAPSAVPPVWPVVNGAVWRAAGDGFETEIPRGEEIDLLRRLTALDPSPAEIAVTPPSLDELYAHFLGWRV